MYPHFSFLETQYDCLPFFLPAFPCHFQYVADAPRVPGIVYSGAVATVTKGTIAINLLIHHCYIHYRAFTQRTGKKIVYGVGSQVYRLIYIGFMIIGLPCNSPYFLRYPVHEFLPWHLAMPRRYLFDCSWA